MRTRPIPEEVLLPLVSIVPPPDNVGASSQIDPPLPAGTPVPGGPPFERMAPPTAIEALLAMSSAPPPEPPPPPPCTPAANPEPLPPLDDLPYLVHHVSLGVFVDALHVLSPMGR